MATYVIYAGTADAQLQSVNASLATARSGGTKSVQNAASATMTVGEQFLIGNYYTWALLLSFDIAGAAIDGIVSAVTLSLRGTADNTSLNNPTLRARQHDWGGTADTGDWLGSGGVGAKTLVATRATSTWSTSGYNDFTSEAGWPAALSATTEYLHIMGDLSEAGGSSNAPAGSDSYVTVNSADASGTTNDPKLTVTAAPAPPDAPTLSGLAADRHARATMTVTEAGTGTATTGVKVFRSQAPGGTYAEVTSNCTIVDNGDGTWTVTDKRPMYGSQPILHGETAYYKAKAYNTGGDSDYSGYNSATIDVDRVEVERQQWANLVTYETANSAYFQTNAGFLGGAYPGPWLLAAAYIATAYEDLRAEALGKLDDWWTYIQTNHIDAHHILANRPPFVYRDDHFRFVMHVMLCVRLLRQITGDSTADALRASMVAEANAMGGAAIDLLATTGSSTTRGMCGDWPTVAGATAWAATTVYNATVVRRPTVANGRIYRCIAGGTSGGSEPTWPTTTRGIVQDGTCYWQECTSDFVEWTANTAYEVGDIVLPTTRNNRTYLCTVAGTSHASTQPTWPTSDGGTVTDGTVTWKETSRSGAIFYASYSSTYPYGGPSGSLVDLNQTSEIAAALALLYKDPEATDFYTGGSKRSAALTLIEAHAGRTAACVAPFGGIPVQEINDQRWDSLYGSFTLHTMAVTVKEMGGAGWDPQVWAFVNGGLNWMDANWQTEPTIGNDTGGVEAYASGPLNLDELAWRNAAYQIAVRANATEPLIYDSSCHPTGTYTHAGQAAAEQIEDSELWQSVGVWAGVLGVPDAAGGGGGGNMLLLGAGA